VALGFEFGPVTVSRFPGVVGVIDRIYPLSDLAELAKSGVAVLEFRLDLFEDRPLDETLAYLASVYHLKLFGILGTIRETRLNAMIRYGLFEAILPYVDMIDIEVDSPIGLSLDHLAKLHGKKVLISDHNYEQTPSEDELEQLYAQAMVFGPEIIKFAYYAASRDDMVRLLAFCHAKSFGVARPLVCAIAMGEAGCVSRLIAGAFGSCLTYGYLGESGVAPGQLSAMQLVGALASLGQR
jgi:3-dehydroquinate dehydratase I